jgi:hypothetical protein
LAVSQSIVADHCLAPGRSGAPLRGGGYRSLFPELPALDVDEVALRALGAPGGPCDLAARSGVADNDSAVAAVWPFFGQFVAHDITADRSPLGHRSDRERLQNFRAPRANLESLYGVGPVGSPYLYRQDDPASLLLAVGGHDVPRNHQGIGLLGDPRNDSHLFMNQMHVAFIHLHNRLARRLRADGTPTERVFAEARHATTWHYQHVILREFLPGLIGRELCTELLGGAHRDYRVDDEPYIPLEFADAAYRYGHSQIRESYQVNAGLGPCPVFPDLIGFRPVAPEHVIDWSLLVDVPGRPPAQRAKRIDGCLPSALIRLPTEISGERAGGDYASLANRDLQRGQAVGLPSGEAVARRLGVEPLTPLELGLAEHGWREETPLWLYVLKEAETIHAGEQLGPVGGRIVGEVIVGIIDADPESFRSVQPDWTPTMLRTHQTGRFGLVDILAPIGGCL